MKIYEAACRELPDLVRQLFSTQKLYSKKKIKYYNSACGFDTESSSFEDEKYITSGWIISSDFFLLMYSTKLEIPPSYRKFFFTILSGSLSSLSSICIPALRNACSLNLVARTENSGSLCLKNS